ncbi:MAG: helix-turn-helix domain-containing protein, partial [Acidimicrobiia bacterium]
MDNEYEVRCRAVELADAGWKTTAIGQEPDRSPRWVRKRVRRFESEGETGLEDRSRRPKRSPNRLGDTVRGEILRVRGALEKHRHANVGPKAIRAKMQRTDRLLKLITLQLNGHADEAAWAEIIRQHLLNRSGHAHHQ